MPKVFPAQPAGTVDHPPAEQLGPAGPPVPLSVWLTGQVCSRDQRRNRYLRASHAHPAKMLPAIARQLIATYTRPGETVLDPMAGIGTTVVEAAHAGRHGIGVEYEPGWVRLATANLAHAATQGATGTGQVFRGDARRLADLLPAGLRGSVALVVTSPPYGPSVHGHLDEQHKRHGTITKVNNRYGSDPRNLAHVDNGRLGAGFTQILSGCVPMLRPGGHLAVTARPYRHHHELVDIPGMVITAAQRSGLLLVDRCAALIAGIRDGRLIARPSFFQLRNIRTAHRRGDPQWLLQHEEVLIFTRPEPAPSRPAHAAGRPDQAGSR